MVNTLYAMTISRLFLFIIILLFLFILPSSAFMETFEYHPSADVELSWDNDTYNYGAEPWNTYGFKTHSSGTVINEIVYYSILKTNVSHIKSDARYGPDWIAESSSINAEPFDTDYISINILEINTGKNGLNSYGKVEVRLYETDGSGPVSILLSQDGTDYYNPSFYEFQIISSQLYLIINGTSQGIISAWGSENIGYIEIWTKASSIINAVEYYGYGEIYFDDISTSGNIVGIHADRSPNSDNTHYMTHTELDNDDQPDYEVNASYTINTLSSSPTDAQYQMKIRRIYDGSIVNTTTIKDAGTAWSNSAPPFGTILYNRTDIFGENFGLYQFYTTKDGAIQSYDLINWQYTSLSGNSWVDIPDTISSDTKVDIDYYIDAPEFGDYNYYIKVYDPDYAITQTYTITTAYGTETLDTSGYDSGIYIVIMTAVAKSGGSSFDIAYDMTTISDEVIVVGTTYNATDNSVIPTVYINDSQGSTWFNTTSDGSGDYELQGFSSSILTTINASKTNYTHEDFTWTPPQVGYYTMDLYLFPSNRTLTNNATMLEGMVVSYPLQQGVGNATVNVYNATWSDSMTASSWGYYNFSNITAGDYTVNATLAGYTDSSEYSITISNNNSTVQNIVLHPIFTLTVTADDSETSASLSEFTAIVNGETVSTTNGTATFTLDYGLYTISVSSSGYYPNTANVLLNQNKSVEVSLTPVESIYYNPHYVKFTVQNIWGTKYTGVDVSVYEGTETDTSFTGTTGSDGSVTFKLSETTQYRITFINSTAGINKEITIYPVDTHYIIYVSTVDLSIPDTTGDDVGYYWTTERINTTHAYINFTWTDTSSSSTGFTYWINDSTNTPMAGYPDTSTTTNYTNSTIVPASSDRYYVHVIADHPTWGEIKASDVIFFGGRMIDMGWSEDWHYSTVALCAIIFIGLLAGAVTAHYMAVICVMFAWFFRWIGWLDTSSTSTLLLILCTVVAFGFAMRKGEVVKV